MDLKVLIADDDEGIRLLLKKVIEKTNGFEWIGEAEDGECALRLYETLRPELVFLDVEMPKVNGVECARRIAEINPKTFFIFVTAHEEYMSEAFQVYAADYLIKPFKIERLEQTLERIALLFQQPEERPVRKAVNREKGLEKLFIRNKEGISLVDMKEIILIQREERATVIYTAQSHYTTSETLSELEERLDPGTFFRSHKSYIINLAMIEKIYPYGRWTYLMKFKNIDRDALVTHERYEELENIFK